MAERALMLELHDVAPESWPDYESFVCAVDALGSVAFTWLVVPDFHQRNPLDKHPEFCRMLDGRLARGDELVLHGYYHADDAPPPRSPLNWLMRRVYTREGEFSALSEAVAHRRISEGMALFQRHGWPLHGFVAPGWLLGEGARNALADSGLLYSSAPWHFHLLPDFEPIDAPGLVWSAGRTWRRGVSWMLSESLLQLWREAPILRMGLHPEDMRHDFSRRYWLALLSRLLADGRRSVTSHDWLQRQLQQRASI